MDTQKTESVEATSPAPRFKLLWPGVVFAVVLLVGIGSITLALVLRRQGRDIFAPAQMQIYFFNPTEGYLQAESRPWPYGFARDWVAAAIGHLRFAPNSRDLVSAWPDINPLLGVEETPFLLDFVINERTLIVDFSDAYMEMSPMQEALFRSAFTLTMVHLGFIDEVKIRTGGFEWLESAETIANAPTISSARLADTQFTLYFIHESGEGLVREIYDAVDVDMGQRARFALERLIDGVAPEGAISAIPADTRIIAVIPATETASVYVNLSGEFLSNFRGGPMQAQLMTAAIVNTVLENSPGMWQVFFLIDSMREEHVPGIGDLSGAFEYDETVMVGFVPVSLDNEDTGE